MKKTLFLAAVMSAAACAYAADDITGSYLMSTTDDRGMTSRSEVTISATDTPDIVEVSGIIDTDFEGTILTAIVDEEAKTLTFQAGQEGNYWGSQVSLTLLEETEDDFAPVDGPLVASFATEGKIIFEGTWGFIYPDDNYPAYVVTAAEMARPNATMIYRYQNSALQQTEGSVPLLVQYTEGRLTVDGFNPNNTDEMGPMTFIIDETDSTATLADPDTPNTVGWYDDNYLCTITAFSGNYQNPGLQFTKGLTCAIENGNTLVFPARWGIVRINRDEASAEPMIRGIYAGGRLELKFPLIQSETGVATINACETETAYYDLMGRRLAKPTGMCIKVSGGKATKVVIRH